MWPQSLRAMIRLILNTKHPMFIWWGPDLIQFYNDGYKATMGPERHPSALGARGRDCWAEIWGVIGPQIEHVLAGKGSTWDEDRLVPVTRHGRRENVWWTYSYSPIDLDGAVGGVLVVCNDVTSQHVAAEGLRDQNKRLQELFEQAPSFIAVLKGRDHVYEITNMAYKRLVGDRDFIGKSVREVMPDVEGQGYFELLDRVFETGKAHVGKQMPLTLQPIDSNSPKGITLDFVYQPIFDSNGKVTGIFVAGTDVTEHVLTESRMRVLNDELKHRVKNTIAVIGAIASQTMRGKGKDAEVDAFRGRLVAFGKAHDILTASNWTSAKVHEVVEEALLPHRTGSGRFCISGPDVTVGSQQALSLSLAIHELATNAIKYGALSCETGQVTITWADADPGGKANFKFTWEEAGGPAVVDPGRRGFGSKLLTQIFAGDFGGNVTLSYDVTGFKCQLLAPRARLRSSALDAESEILQSTFLTKQTNHIPPLSH
jgi:two-component sensor histidine kinase